MLAPFYPPLIRSWSKKGHQNSQNQPNGAQHLFAFKPPERSAHAPAPAARQSSGNRRHQICFQRPLKAANPVNFAWFDVGRVDAWSSVWACEVSFLGAICDGNLHIAANVSKFSFLENSKRIWRHPVSSTDNWQLHYKTGPYKNNWYLIRLNKNFEYDGSDHIVISFLFF